MVVIKPSFSKVEVYEDLKMNHPVGWRRDIPQHAEVMILDAIEDHIYFADLRTRKVYIYEESTDSYIHINLRLSHKWRELTDIRDLARYCIKVSIRATECWLNDWVVE